MADPQTHDLARAGRYSIRYGDDVIAFALRLQPQRQPSKLAVHVEPDGRVLVDAPEGVSQAIVMAAVRKRASWIVRHVTDARARLAHVRPRDYTSGEAVHYLGRRYKLRVTVDPAAAASCRLRGIFLEVTVRQRSAQAVRDAMAVWYRQRAREVLRDRMDVVARGLRWVQAPPPMRLQWMRVQWGSCSPGGRITLHPALVQAPRECIDYVLLHELVHLLHHNHSPAFYQTMDRHMPRWPAVKLKLDGLAEQALRS